MQTYLVGGAVRDHLLNRPVKDNDWVVVGATPEEMISKGYEQVGADFPVFLHPFPPFLLFALQRHGAVDA